MPVELTDPGEPLLSSHQLADGRFQVTRTLGVGGMATVYAVEDARLGVQRALKVLNSALSEKPQVRSRFIAEARTMASLEHRNIVRVYDVDLDGEQPYIVMELLDGGSLVDWVRENGPMPPRLAVDVIIEILNALKIAHRGGVIHRDIKPHNVLLTTDGKVKVTDFGIARSNQLEQDADLTRTGTIMGTWAFMAPEQRTDAKNVDPRADLYATGATLCALVTDRTPSDLFAAELDSEILSDVPAALHPFIKKATRYRREERFADADEMLQAAASLREQLPMPPRESAPLSGARSSTITLPNSAPLPSKSATPVRPQRSLEGGSDHTFAVDNLEDGFSSEATGIPRADAAPPARLLRYALISSIFFVAFVLIGLSALNLTSPEPQTLTPVALDRPVQPSIEFAPTDEDGSNSEMTGDTENAAAAASASGARTDPLPAAEPSPVAPHIQYRITEGRVPTVQAWVAGSAGYDQLTLLWRTSPNQAWQETAMTARNTQFVAPLTPDRTVQFFMTARSSSQAGRTLRIGSAASPLSL